MKALITGANRGIGLALAQLLSSDDHQVTATYRSSHPIAAGKLNWMTLHGIPSDAGKSTGSART